MIKSGLLLFNPLIRQLSKESSALIDFEVDKIQSCRYLKRWTVFLEKKLVILFFFLLIVRKSLDIAIFAVKNGISNFLFMK